MKKNPFLILTAVTLLFFPKVNFGQAPNLKSSARFAIFTSAGAITNLGQTKVTGDLGTFAGANGEAPLPAVNGEFYLGFCCSTSSIRFEDCVRSTYSNYLRKHHFINYIRKRTNNYSRCLLLGSSYYNKWRISSGCER